MIIWTDYLNKQFRNVSLLAVVLYIMAPLCYIFVAYTINKQGEVSNYDNIMLLYILLFVGIAQPLIIPFYEKIIIKAFKKNPEKAAAQLKVRSMIQEPRTPSKLELSMAIFYTLSIIKAAIIESIYIYGFIIFFITRDINLMFYFYPIGILWTLKYFPRKSQFEIFIEKVESYEQS